jgi:Na+/H+ antiporter NhaC
MLQENEGRNVCHIGQFVVILPIIAMKGWKIVPSQWDLIFSKKAASAYMGIVHTHTQITYAWPYMLPIILQKKE